MLHCRGGYWVATLPLHDACAHGGVRTPRPHFRKPVPAMHVQYVALCEQVIIGTDGKPSLIGVVSDVQVPGLPATLPRLAFAARIHFTPDEVGTQRRVDVVVKDPAGTELGRTGGDLGLPPMPPGADSLAVDLPIGFDFFELQATGRYTFLLEIDGKASAAVQLTVRQAANG
jgi:hypothetical protein